MKLLMAFLTILFVMCASIFAKDKPTAVEAVQGRAEIHMNSTAGETILVFKGLSVGRETDEVVFVIQHLPTMPLPQEWSGKARLFISDGMLALSGENDIKWMFKFPERGVPDSLAKMQFEVFPVFGIARYGDSGPIPEPSFTNLKTHGRCASPSLLDGPLNLDQCKECTSGGEGSTSCSAGSGGCSVSCGTGYFACCNVNTNNCRCCKTN